MNEGVEAVLRHLQDNFPECTLAVDENPAFTDIAIECRERSYRLKVSSDFLNREAAEGIPQVLELFGVCQALRRAENGTVYLWPAGIAID